MNRRIARVTTLAAVALALAGPAAAQSVPAPAMRASAVPPKIGTRWVVDPVHSQVEFRVHHLLGRVRGSFTRWYGVISTRSEDWTHGTVNVQVQTASINTGNGYRDADLRSPRFLDSDSFPAMVFESTGIVATDSTVEIGGILTLRGQSRNVVLKGRFDGVGRDQQGKQRIAFDATTAVDRRDFGISYNEMVEGSKVIGDDIEITIAIEAVRATS
jgi:polyisoprenoid-binding protein YceI